MRLYRHSAVEISVSIGVLVLPMAPCLKHLVTERGGRKGIPHARPSTSHSCVGQICPSHSESLFQHQNTSSERVRKESGKILERFCKHLEALF